MIGAGLANTAGGWLLDNVFSAFEQMNIVLLGVNMTRYNFMFALSPLLRCILIYIALPRLIHEENNTPALGVIRGFFASVKENIKKLKRLRILRRRR